eukprot:scaffold17694_cov118-Isochrysis_galbana.AAC.4
MATHAGTRDELRGGGAPKRSSQASSALRSLESRSGPPLQTCPCAQGRACQRAMQCAGAPARAHMNVARGFASSREEQRMHVALSEIALLAVPCRGPLAVPTHEHRPRPPPPTTQTCASMHAPRCEPKRRCDDARCTNDARGTIHMYVCMAVRPGRPAAVRPPFM